MHFPMGTLPVFKRHGVRYRMQSSKGCDRLRDALECISEAIITVLQKMM